MQAATPGAIGFETAASLVWEAIGDPLPWAIALSSGPAAVLGERPLPPTLGQRCPDLVLFDPTATWVGSSASTVASHRNQPLDGRAMIGRVRAVVRAGSLRVVRG
jgi:dihydroorotase-like cyclic amidohydrolase